MKEYSELTDEEIKFEEIDLINAIESFDKSDL